MKKLVYEKGEYMIVLLTCSLFSSVQQLGTGKFLLLELNTHMKSIIWRKVFQFWY